MLQKKSLFIGDIAGRRILEGNESGISWNKNHPALKNVKTLTFVVKCGKTNRRLGFLSPVSENCIVTVVSSGKSSSRPMLGRLGGFLRGGGGGPHVSAGAWYLT